MTPLDFRVPVRAGFAYTELSRAPAFSLSMGAEADVARITSNLAFTLVGDIEANARPDLPEKDPRSSFGSLGFGGGLFYCGESSVGFGIESTVSFSFDSQDLVGAGFGTRIYVVPFYVRFAKALNQHGDTFSAWVRSAFSVWVSARMDFTSDGSGATLAFGASLDFVRIFLMPYTNALVKVLR